MPERFNWLHLTDLHYGQAGQRPLWPNVREAFLEDLRRLHDRAGPWHAVFFTGDLVQSGKADEFAQMEAEVLGRLWKELAALGSGDAVLFAVPGNHDLLRPKLSAAVRQLTGQGGLAAIEEEFWGEPDGEYREVIARAFASYGIWWRDTSHRPQLSVNDGLLPGDFAATLQVGSHRIGIVGLNTTFLQLTPSDFRGRLAWDVRQLHAVCGGDVADWLAKHDACLLLTHQGPEWLDAHPSGLYPELNPAGRFATHLFGHMHETEVETRMRGGGKPLRQWQGCSLFGLEKYGDPPVHERRHGYAAGRIELGSKTATIRLWPRWATQDANGWRLVPDHENGVLCEDEGTEPEPLAGGFVSGGKRRKPAARQSRVAPQPDQRALVSTYTEAARRLWDIIGLAGLPEDERRLTMQHFMLRQLYLPLRMTIEPVLTEEELAALEQKREEQRLIAAGRAAGETRAQPERISLGAWLQTALSSPLSDGKGKARNEAAVTPRLVILGDPGGGKTTLLRWFATACLLHHEGNQDLATLPDVESLPAIEWLPVLVRCRDLDKTRVGQATLEDLLRESLSKMQMDEAQVGALATFLRAELAAARAVLLVDGLDEITDPGPRAAFSERIEAIARCFPQAPILATSRIVGYREMRRRLGESFAHATLAELTPEEKDDFIGRWCEVTIADPARRASEAEKLRRGIHGSNRIERLTTSPMLLTTMALVQHKVGKLPTRRHKLYWEAVGLLLNWRGEVEDQVDPEEALPQLEYLAYAMCDRDVQRLRRDQVLALLEGVRRDYPNIRPVHARTPEAFLAALERRTALLMEVGEVTYAGKPVPIYEFRHLTFQEYLAALALLEGRFPGQRPLTTLAERVRPLAEQVREYFGCGIELLVTQNWSEPLRLCVASCSDDDVGRVVWAILKPTRAEEARPRAILALLCLADQPNVPRAIAEEVLRTFAQQVREEDGYQWFGGTEAHRAAIECVGSTWAEPLRTLLVDEFIRRDSGDRSGLQALASKFSAANTPRDQDERRDWITHQTATLKSPLQEEAVGAALAISDAASHGNDFEIVPGLIDHLFALIGRSAPAAHAASLALSSLLWRFLFDLAPSPAQLSTLMSYITDPRSDSSAVQELIFPVSCFRPPGAEAACVALLKHLSPRVRRTAARSLANCDGEDAARSLRECLRDEDGSVRQAAADTLGRLGDQSAVASLRECLNDEDVTVRQAAADALGKIGSPKAVASLREALRHQDGDTRGSALGGLAQRESKGINRQLLTHNFDGFSSWLDPQEPISSTRVREAARKLSVPEEEVRRRYEALADEYGLRLEWRIG